MLVDVNAYDDDCELAQSLDWKFPSLTHLESMECDDDDGWGAEEYVSDDYRMELIYVCGARLLLPIYRWIHLWEEAHLKR